jgi:hypothetical protein
MTTYDSDYPESVDGWTSNCVVTLPTEFLDSSRNYDTLKNESDLISRYKNRGDEKHSKRNFFE